MREKGRPWIVHKIHFVWHDGQIVFQHLAIYNNENLPKSIQIIPKWVHNFAKYQRFLNSLLKRWNFAKSGHTELATQMKRFHDENVCSFQMIGIRRNQFLAEATAPVSA